jgi:hypothetical protein
MKKAFVICCNDSIEFVVLDNEYEAHKILEERKRADYDNKKAQEGAGYQSFEEYCHQFFWHTHDVEYK